MNYRAIKFDENPLLRPGLPIERSRIMQWLLLLVFFMLAVRSFYLQFFDEDFLQKKGNSLYRRTIDVPAMRGKITDRNGDVLAMTTPVKSVWVNPNALRASSQPLSVKQINRLGQLLHMPAEDIRKRLKEETDFTYLKRQISPQMAQQVEALDLPGVNTQTEYRRYYPGGAGMAHVVGFVGIDGQGQEGLELSCQADLRGTPGRREVIRDRKGSIIDDVQDMRLPQHGKDLVLSIDSGLQYFTFKRLREAVEKHQAKSGSVIVMDGKTGEILAMANYPSFNPNNRETFTPERLRNRAVTDLFEPGSVMKPITVGLALEKHVVKPETIIDLKPGFIQFGPRRVRDVHVFDALSVTDVIRKSSNVGTVKIAMLLSNNDMDRLLTDIGFGQETGIQLPGEAKGRWLPASRWRAVDKATISYGYGISATLIQLAKAYTVFVRDGDVVSPTLFKAAAPAKGKRIFSRETVMKMRQMLENTAQAGGTGALAMVPGYRVGGKTGTANKLDKGRYTNKHQVSFVGIAPMSNPRYIVAVTVDEPSVGAYYGGSVAAPVFSDVMGHTLRQLGVLPDAPHTVHRRNVDPESLVEGL